MAIFSIPGNIKQMNLPFVLDPKQSLNTYEYKEAKNVIGIPQVFSFRNTKEMINRGLLNICPTSLKNKFIDDISFRYLYNDNAAEKTSDGTKNTDNISINTILNTIPGIQIREFLPDTRLDQALDFFSNLIQGVLNLFKNDKEQIAKQNEANNKKTNDDQIDDNILQKITRVCKYAVKYLTGFADQDLYTDTFGKLNNSILLNQKYQPSQKKLQTYIYNFPYTMWYQLQSCTTTNLYELPCIIENREMYASNGTPGWPSAGISLAKGGITNVPIIGSLVKNLLGNVNISLMPWWDAKEGNATPAGSVNIKFDLFNDTAESALINFIFVNTIVPNAKWIQYNMFQHSPHLYDIKLEGYGRLYACTGNFKVTQVGILRNMPNSWILNKLKPHINNCMNATTFLNAIISENLIKIPDIYHVELTFDSLLPDNFNNYLYRYSHNLNIINTYSDGKNTRTNSAALSALSNGINGMIDNVVKVWNGELNDDGLSTSKNTSKK